MRKVMTCLLVLSLSLIGCTTATTIGGVRGFHYPTPREGGEVGVRIRSGSGVDKEVVSVDQDMLLPTPNGPEPSVPVELTELEIMAVVLIITSIVRDAINSIPFFY